MQRRITFFFLSIMASAMPIAGQEGPAILSHVIPHAAQKGQPASGLPATASIRVDVQMALVPVSVLDPYGRNVTGLQRHNFRLTVGKESREIASFSREDQPISVGLVFDCSSSMADKFAPARDASAQLLMRLNEQDESFVVTVSERARMLDSFTSEFERLRNELIFAAPHGNTALLDGVSLGLAQIKKAKNPRRALIVVSDGGDNCSRYTLRELKRMAIESDAQIYALGLHFNPRTVEEEEGPELLAELAGASGGLNFDVESSARIASVMGNILATLRNQYVLGFYTPQNSSPGKYHAVKVQLRVPAGLPRLHVYAKSGYYMPE
jgi:VWFA-related protein